MINYLDTIYNVIIPDIQYGNNIDSQFNIIEPNIELQEPEITEEHEYSSHDIGNEIFTTSDVPHIKDTVLLSIKQDYWRISEREWLLEKINELNKILKIEELIVCDGDYKDADKNSKYYKVNISPPFTDDESNDEHFQNIPIEERNSILVDCKHIDSNRDSIIKITKRKSKKTTTVDVSKMEELSSLRVENIVIENALKVLDKYLEYTLKIIKNIDILLPFEDKLQVLDICKELTNQTDSKKVTLKGPQPVSISLDEFNPNNQYSILSQYAVTEKADGIRAELIIINKKGYLITTLTEKYKHNNIPKIMDTGLLFNGVEGRWLFDGEFITQDKNANNLETKLYKIFDVYFAGDGASKYPNDAFKYPWIGDDVSREKILSQFMEDANITTTFRNNKLLIDVKKYYYGPKKISTNKKTGKFKNLSAIGKECKKILNIDNKKIGYGY